MSADANVPNCTVNVSRVAPAGHRPFRPCTPGRTFLRVFSTFGLVFAIVLTAQGTWSVADEILGSAIVAYVA